MAKHPTTSNCAVFLALLSACAGSTCPVGSRAMGDQCVPLDGCPSGQERRHGACAPVDEPAVGGDASIVVDGGDSGIGPDAALPMGGGAAPDTGVGEPPLSDGGENDPCMELDCGAHGVCELDLMGEPYCACDAGFTGESCDACVAGLGLSSEGDCVPLCDAVEAIDCGPFGTCVADESGAACSCTRPHAGERCELCAEGYALAGGECVPDCGDCGPHEFCDATLLVPTCACVAGYGMGATGCTWIGDGLTGGIKDRTLDDRDAWIAKGATFDDGMVSFATPGGDRCSLGVLSQTITMPKREDAEALVLEIDATTPCTDGNVNNCPGLIVEFAESSRRVSVPSSPSQQTFSICLGASAFGGELELRVRPALPNTYATPVCDMEWPTLSALRMRRASQDECPPADRIWNGDFTTYAGWSTTTNTAIADGKLTFSGDGAATTKVEFPIPFDRPSAALRFTRTTNNVDVRLDGLHWVLLRGSGASEQTLCLPDFALGSVHELTFGGIANTQISNLQLVSEPNCGTGAFDGEFTRALNTGSWWAYYGNPALRADPDTTHGAAVRTAPPTVTQLRALVRIPVSASQAEGHAAFLYERRTDAADSIGTVVVTGLGPNVQSTFSSSRWSRSGTQCLPLWLEGQWTAFQLAATGRLASSASTATDAPVWLDNAEVSLSVSCQ